MKYAILFITVSLVRALPHPFDIVVPENDVALVPEALVDAVAVAPPPCPNPNIDPKTGKPYPSPPPAKCQADYTPGPVKFKDVKFDKRIIVLWTGNQNAIAPHDLMEFKMEEKAAALAPILGTSSVGETVPGKVMNAKKTCEYEDWRAASTNFVHVARSKVSFAVALLIHTKLDIMGCVNPLAVLCHNEISALDPKTQILPVATDRQYQAVFTAAKAANSDFAALKTSAEANGGSVLTHAEMMAACAAGRLPEKCYR